MKKTLKAIATVIALSMLFVMSTSALAEEVVETAPVEEIIVVEEPQVEAAPVEENIVVEEPQAEVAPVEVAPVEEAPVEVPQTEEEIISEPVVEEIVEEALVEEIAPETIMEEEKTIDTSNVTINIHFVGGTQVHMGDEVTVKAEINGLDEVDYTMQWQYFDGEWHDAQGATSTSYTFTVNDSNISYLWRIVVDIAE